jgi:hypothetical protein
MPTLRNPATRHLFAGLPSFAHLLRRKHVERVSGTPLSLRNRSDSNYYHATIECFGALAAYVEADFLDGNTLVIGKGLAGTPIWSEFEQLGGLRSISHVVQRSAWIVGGGEVAFVDLPRVDGTWTDVDGPITISEVTPSSLRRTRALLESVLPPRSHAPHVHLTVVRGASDGRQLRNADEVADFFRARGFELVDPGTMSWTQQVELFRRAARVAGVHGAALTNVLYRWPERMQLLEIAEPGRVAKYFRNIACALEYEYAEVTGTRGEGRVRRQTFEVDVDAIARVLDAWDRPTR